MPVLGTEGVHLQFYYPDIYFKNAPSDRWRRFKMAVWSRALAGRDGELKRGDARETGHAELGIMESMESPLLITSCSRRRQGEALLG